MRIDEYKTFDDFKNNLSYLMDYDKELPFDLGKPMYNLSPVFCKGTKDKRFRYLELDNGYTLFYKVLQIINTKQIRCFILQDNKEVLEYLKTLPFVRLIAPCKIYEEMKPIHEYDDYYYDFTLRPEISSNRSHRKAINKFFNNPDYTYSVTDRIDIEVANKVRTAWVKGMEETGREVSKRDSKIFENYCNAKVDGKYVITLYYKKEAFAIAVVVKDKEGIFTSNYNCTISRLVDKDEDNTFYKIVKNNAYIKNKIVKDELNCKKLYIEGAQPNELRLLAHKKQHTDGCQEWFIL